MEASLQLIGEFDDETEDMLQECPIYTELVGMRNTTKMTYVGIAIGIVVVIAAVILCWYCYKKKTAHRYTMPGQDRSYK